MKRLRAFLAGAATLLAARAGLAQGTGEINRDEYATRLRGMWLGECIANWTGLRSEGKVQRAPFLTDADWGRDLGNGPLEFVLDQDPWLADDDTDVEYVALHLLHEHGVSALTGAQLAAGWTAHMDARFLWVSNRQALELMRGGVTPPSTSLPCANQYWLSIDAQLTTEIFGALAPGMPGEALAMAEIPIANTARGHAAHAAQAFMLMRSLAPIADAHLPLSAQIMWVYEEARRYVPDSSKAADIMDFVLADYVANPDRDDWERTRDHVHDRYQVNAGTHGFRYLDWTESSVNFACGLIALLYGQGDYLRTVQIGTLSGWDSDNGTATMGGLLGLMLGYDALVEQIRREIPAFAPSDRYDIDRTRNNLPDYLGEDPEAQDTFSMMAARMLPIIERRIAECGGRVDADRGAWLLPPLPTGDRVALSPRHDLFRRSANCAVRAAGGTVTAWSSVASDRPAGEGSKLRHRIADGFELDDSGRDTIDDGPREVYSTLGAPVSPGEAVEIRVTYDRPVPAASVVFIEGDHLHEGQHVGGWFESATVELLIDGEWREPPGGFAGAPTLDPRSAFQMLEWRLARPVEVTGVRVVGIPGGPVPFVTCSELDVVAGPQIRRGS